MATSIYVGNLPWSITEEELNDLFASYGPVTFPSKLSLIATPAVPEVLPSLKWRKNTPRKPSRTSMALRLAAATSKLTRLSPSPNVRIAGNLFSAHI